MTPKELALSAVKALDSKKGRDIKVLETGHPDHSGRLFCPLHRYFHHTGQGPGRHL